MGVCILQPVASLGNHPRAFQSGPWTHSDDGVVDVEDGIENHISGTALMFNVDPVVTARAGFTPQEVELDASAMLQGEPATPPVVMNDRSYTIRVQFPPAARSTLEAMKNMLLAATFLLWGFVQLMSQSEWSRKLGDLVIALFVMDLAWTIFDRVNEARR